MRKKLIMTAILSVGTLSLATLTSPAGAVNACINLSESTSCSSTSEEFQMDWSMTCENTVVTGVGFCAPVAGQTIGFKLDILPSNTGQHDLIDNKFCWCKMISPAVSKWIFILNYTSDGECSYECASRCANHFESTSSLRFSLFSDMTD